MSFRPILLASLLLIFPDYASCAVHNSVPRPAPRLIQLGALIRGSRQIMLRRTDDYHRDERLKALSPEKASIFLQRAMQVDSQEVESQAQLLSKSQRLPSQEIMLAINSVLQDFSTEDLSRASAQQLHHLAGLVFDQLPDVEKDFDPWVNLEGLTLLAEKKKEKILGLRRHNILRKKTLYSKGFMGPAAYSVEGRTRKDRFLPPEPIPPVSGTDDTVPMRDQVFRYYAPIDLGKIGLADGLWNALSSYVRTPSSFFGKMLLFKDLTGLFVTLPNLPPEAVGVPASRYYVDFRLPRALPVLEIEPGKIFMVPLPHRAVDGIWRSYREQIRGYGVPSVAAHLYKVIQLLNSNNTPGPELSVPIELVGFGAAPSDPKEISPDFDAGFRIRPDVVLFDWDNTLADEQEIRQAVSAEMFRRLGRPVPAPGEEDYVWATSRESYYTTFFPGIEPKLVDQTYYQVMEELRRGEPINGKRYPSIRLLPGAKALLQALRARGIRMSIVSNKPQAQLRQEIEQTGLTSYFELILGQKAGRKPKPSPDPVHEALAAMKIAPGNVWFIGDELVDMQAANQAGIRRILVGSRWRGAVVRGTSKDDPAGAIRYANRNQDILSLVERLAHPAP